MLNGSPTSNIVLSVIVLKSLLKVLIFFFPLFIVVENMSCQGNTVGGKFEELKGIIDRVHDKSRIGVCLDTCHAFAAGKKSWIVGNFLVTLSVMNNELQPCMRVIQYK